RLSLRRVHVMPADRKLSNGKTAYKAVAITQSVPNSNMGSAPSRCQSITTKNRDRLTTASIGRATARASDVRSTSHSTLAKATGSSTVSGGRQARILRDMRWREGAVAIRVYWSGKGRGGNHSALL